MPKTSRKPNRPKAAQGHPRNKPGPREELVVVGALAGAHGVRGDVRVRSFTTAPEDVFAYGPLLDDAGSVLLEAQAVRPAKDHFVVVPAASGRSREDWEALKGTLLHVPRSALPPAEEDEVYIDDLVGLTAQSEAGVPLGTVKAVQNFGAGDLLEIAPSGGGKSVLIPFTEADIPTLNLAAGHLTLATWDIWTSDAP
ncbi:MAG: ribosome maturation factor RimM [Pseudomonadota bacterium]